MLLSELWDWSVLCHISIFDFSFSVDRLSLYVSSCDFITSVILQCSLLTILHTHKRCGFCLRKARVPDTNSIISWFNVCVKKSNWKLLNSKQALKFMSLTEYRKYHCFFKTTKNVRSKLHIYQIRLRINFEKSGALYMWNLSRNCFTFKQWSMVWLTKMHLYVLFF